MSYLGETMTTTQYDKDRGNTVPLRDYFESRLHAIEKGIELADSKMQMRLQSMNEFRDALKDQAAEFVTDSEVCAKFDAIENRIKTLEISRAELSGKANQSTAMWAFGMGIAGMLISLIGLISKFL